MLHTHSASVEIEKIREQVLIGTTHAPPQANTKNSTIHAPPQANTKNNTEEHVLVSAPHASEKTTCTNQHLVEK
jgi:hypothetical protein